MARSSGVEAISVPLQRLFTETKIRFGTMIDRPVNEFCQGEDAFERVEKSAARCIRAAEIGAYAFNYAPEPRKAQTSASLRARTLFILNAQSPHFSVEHVI
jgi:hypothetical protein